MTDERPCEETAGAQLRRQVARLRLAHAQLEDANRRERERARALIERIRLSRQTRWLDRYEAARARHERFLHEAVLHRR